MKIPGICNFRLCTLSDKDLAEKVASGLNRMYESPFKVPSRSIPARPNADFDLLVGELIVRNQEKDALLTTIREFNFAHKVETGEFLFTRELVEKIIKAQSYDKKT